MKLYISNSFSLSMLDRESQDCDAHYGTVVSEAIRIPRIPRPVDDPREFLACWMECDAEIVSVLGHASTQGLFEAVLGIPVPVNRTNVRLADVERILVGQYIGPRLPEGATELPEGATLEWWVV